MVTTKLDVQQIHCLLFSPNVDVTNKTLELWKRPVYYSVYSVYSYFEKGCPKNVHVTIRKVIWHMIDTLFLTTLAVEPTFVAFL